MAAEFVEGERFGSLRVDNCFTAYQFRLVNIATDQAVEIDGCSLNDYIRHRIGATFCPRCGSCTRGALLTMNLQCGECDAFDQDKLGDDSAPGMR